MMRVRAVSLATALMLGTGALAVSPAPPPAFYVASWKAIDALGAFDGFWKGHEEQHVPGGETYTHVAYWRVTRLGWQDVMLFEHGYEGENPQSGHLYDKPHSDEFNVLTYDPFAQRYVVSFPGYRLFRGSEHTNQTALVEHPDASTLVWEFRADGGARRRTTLVIDKDMLRQSVDLIDKDGSSRRVSDAMLTHARPEPSSAS